MSATDPERMAALEAELAALRSEMQDFTYTVSHDLRAPLRHILSYVQLVEEDAAHLLPEETRGFLTTIADSAKHLGVLLEGLTELSRTGSAPLQLASQPLLPLLHDLVAELGAQHPARSLAWSLPAHNLAVRADAALLRRAIACLLDNAVKFTSLRADAQITLTTALQADGPGAPRVALCIADNGAGFNPAQQDKLFKPLQRLHTTRQFAGIGMGLALAHKAAVRMGGSVQIEGAPDQGCRVTLTLPAATD